MLVTLLVMTFLLGPIVLLYWLGSLPFLVFCTGLPVLLIWVTMGFPFWNFSSCLNSGLATGFLVKRWLDLMFGLVVHFRFPLFLFQREWKFGTGVSFSAVLLERWVDFLEGWIVSCLVRLAHICQGCVIWGGINVLTVLLLGRWNLVITVALVQFVGFWVTLRVPRRSFWTVS